MKTTKLLLLASVISLNTVFAQDKVNEDAQSKESVYLELPRIEVIPIKDTQNQRQYELFIKLPEGYTENAETHYPVLYTTDAIWHIELLSASTEYIMEDVILVGISWQKDISQDLINENGEHVSRYRDYSIRKSSNPEQQTKYQLGQAGNHLDFIRKDVITYVESNYRTDPNNRSYFGYSMGGKFGAYILMTKPDTFKNYILGSPGLRGNIPILTELGTNAALTGKGLNANVFISYGTLEEELGKHAEEFITLLKNRNDESLSLQHEVIEGSHQTAFPMTGVRSVTWLSKINNLPIIESPYFGQKPPGLIPELFAPGIISISGRGEMGVSFSPDLDEMYFTVQKKTGIPADIYFSKLEDKKWTPIKKANFTKGKKAGEMEPFVSYDGKKIYFTAYNADFTDTKIWYVNRLNNGWSNAIKLDSPLNEDEVMTSTLAKNGDLFYTNLSKKFRTYYSPNINGKYPKIQEAEIEFGGHGFISPSQDYLLVDARNREDENKKDADLYVYFKKKDGAWTKPINLGITVSSTFDETVATVTPDGKYLFFSRRTEGDLLNLYWVSTEVIENVRPKL